MAEREPCDLCEREYHWRPEDAKLCARHYAELYQHVRCVFHRDVPQWAIDALLSEAHQELVCRYWRSSMPDTTVHVFSRREAETAQWQWSWEHLSEGHRVNFRPPYSFRGWCSHHRREIVILVDETETPESVRWIFWHELGHMAVGSVPLIDRLFDLENGPGFEYDWQDDVQHEACHEEQFVNRIATKLVGANYDRHWWRKRVNELLAQPKEAHGGD